MKLLPVTLTLFDKATNNTYKGTLLLKNLDAVDDTPNNGTMMLEGIQEDDYDGQGAGLFIILVVSLYALSIVLFIGSFIKKKPSASESTDENTVNIYLHKVGDLKEKTARDHFKKLKQSITSKIEKDSEIQKREQVSSRVVKETRRLSQTSSRNSLTEPGVLPGTRIRSTEAIPSTGLLPKEDDATQPLLASGNQDHPSPPVPSDEDSMAATGQNSPPPSRATSVRMLSVISEIPDGETSGSGSPQVGKTVSYHDISHLSQHPDERAFPESQSEPKSIQAKKALSPENMPTQSRSNRELSDGQFTFEEDGSNASLFGSVPKRGSSENVSVEMDSLGAGKSEVSHSARQASPQSGVNVDLAAVHMERPRPRCTARHVGFGEDVWQQMPQKPLPPPPSHRAAQKPSHLHLQIPARPGRSDIWVLRNGRSEVRERTPEDWAPPLELGEPREGQRRNQSPNQTKHTPDLVRYTRHDKSPRDKSPRNKSPRDKSPRDRSPRDKSPRDRSPRDKSPRDKSPRDKSPRDKSPRDKSPRDKSLRDRSPRDKSPRDRSPRDKSPRDRSPRDWSPRDWSPRDWSPRDRSPRGARDPIDTFLCSQDTRSLPLPFRSPSPRRSPPRSPNEHYQPPQARVSQKPSVHPGGPPTDPTPGGLRERKATLRITLDRSPDPTEGDPFSGSTNRAFEQSPKLVSGNQWQHGDVAAAAAPRDRGRTPPRVSFHDAAAGPAAASRLQVPPPHFPVTFNSPTTPRRTLEKDPDVQISKV